MAMDKTGMRQAIEAEMALLPSGASASDAQNAFASAFSAYVAANLVATFTWVAATSGSIPDPVTSMEAEIAFTAFTLVPPANLAAWSTQLQAQMLLGVLSPKLNPISSPSDYFVFTPLPLGAIPWAPLVESGINTYPEGLEEMCDQLITGVKGMIQPGAFLPASHVTLTPPATYIATVCQMSSIA